MIPTSPATTDIEYTWFGYQGESEFELECRRKQSNLFGPAGYVALEDAEVLEMVQKRHHRGRYVDSRIRRSRNRRRRPL